MNYIEARRDITIDFREAHFSNVLNLAIDAATYDLYQGSGIDSHGRIELNRQGAIDSFFQTLNTNFNVIDQYEQEEIKAYVPLILIIDYDGVYAYAQQVYNEPSGNQVKKHRISEKRYYTMTQGRQIITVTLDDYYYVDDLDKNITFEGSYDELRAINVAPIFSMARLDVEQMKQTLITSTIEKELLRINDHNDYAKLNGVNYNFIIPDIKDDIHTSTIDRVGLMVSIQGLPMGSERFNMFSLAGSGIKKETKVVGYNDGGILTYHKEGCPTATGVVIEIFDQAKDAAKAGYYPSDDCN